MLSHFLSNSQIWLKSMRTWYGKLTANKFGDETKEHTDRDRWILSTFTFLEDQPPASSVSSITSVFATHQPTTASAATAVASSTTVASVTNPSEAEEESIESELRDLLLHTYLPLLHQSQKPQLRVRTTGETV